MEERTFSGYYLQHMISLCRQLVPVAGEAETMQGEIVRCASNLYDEGTRNGFMNWDEADEEAVSFLKRHLPDPNVFDAHTIVAISHALEAVSIAGPKEVGGLPVEELEFIVSRAIDWCDANPLPIVIKEDEDYLGHF